ncbi:Integral membrane protein TerC family protein [compost metagenome]
MLEIVLGIDNLVFIAILADKLPAHQRDRARMLGLSLALGMRIALLFSIAWIITLTQPFFSVAGLSFSGRDLILIFGGTFLLAKGTLELYERLGGSHKPRSGKVVHAVFWQVIAQIVVLDAVFSLDSVITAVGMVEELPVMVVAVCAAMAVMMMASKPLMNFVGKHPSVVILCLSFLLMIGFSLVVEGFGFHIPKGYLYAAIGYSFLIEIANLTAERNRDKRIMSHAPRPQGCTDEAETVCDEARSLLQRGQASLAPWVEQCGREAGRYGDIDVCAELITTSTDYDVRQARRRQLKSLFGQASASADAPS